MSPTALNRDVVVPTGMKRCGRCGGVLDVAAFPVDRRTRDGLRKTCRTCRGIESAEYRARYPGPVTAYERRRSLARQGMTSDMYDAMLAAQDGQCAVCGTPPAVGTSLDVDHDHACCPGKRSCGRCVRGLLCNSCNQGLGQFRDTPRLLLAAAAYLMERSP